MILEFYQHLPQQINPIAFSIGSFYIRWYSLSYIMAFVVSYLILFQTLKNSEFKKDAQIFNFLPEGISLKQKFSIFKKRYNISGSNLVLDFLLTAFFSALVGGRIGYVIFYDLSYFISNPLSMISPYHGESMVGIYGMSYHGALIGVIASSYVFVKLKKLDFFDWADFVVPAAALGYFFGRIGNFLNGELFGKVTESSLGMYFPADPSHLRYPSQLLEALLEGVVLFLLLLFLRRHHQKKGVLFSFYLIGYALFRIIGEFFRQPDPQLGYLFDLLTMGQLLSMGMLLFGFWILLGGKNLMKVFLKRNL